MKVPTAGQRKQKRITCKHPGGRPSKRTPAILATLAKAVASGLTDEQAAALAGVSADSLARWQRQDPQFCGAIKKARAQRLLLRLAMIEGRAKNWKAIAWILERCYGSQFARPKATIRLEHGSASGMDAATIREAEGLLGLM